MNRWNTRWMRAAGWIALCAGIAGAHPPDETGHHDDASSSHTPHTSARAWTNAKTSEVVRGTFLAAREVDGATRVSIERETGGVASIALADLTEPDRAEAERKIALIRTINAQPENAPGAQRTPEEKQPAGTKDADAEIPAQARTFNRFAPHVTTRWDARWLYVESDGLPHTPGKAGAFVFSHPLMVGITAWQQQVPLPQNYRGANAWQIPLKPVKADRPVSAKEQLFKGAIALAANGVPIFNPIKNDGRTDTFLAGELDEFGGHCGRADDYHYHVAPTHLEKFVGKGQPIAYALDGYAIYGLFEPGAKKGDPKACPLGVAAALDRWNGHESEGVEYHYHASEKYPYLNGGMRGVVTVREDQIDPQPRANPVRDWLQPLRGAKIVSFKQTGAKAWTLGYTVNGTPGSVSYRIEGEGAEASYRFTFVAPDGTRREETYSAQRAGRREGGGGGGREGGRRQPREERGAPRDQKPRDDRPRDDRPRDDRPQNEQPGDDGRLTLESSSVREGLLDLDSTCDGKGLAPALAWDHAPEGTRVFAVVMHHVPPGAEETHVYLVRANIPASARALGAGENSAAGGPGEKSPERWGVNTVNRRAEYAPPCSQGPGEKSYTLTLYALSAEVKIEGTLTRDALLEAIKGTTLATATLEVKYARARGSDEPARRGGPREGQREGQPREGQREGRRGLIEQMTSFKTDVPAHEYNVVLTRPTETSILATIASVKGGFATVERWREGSDARTTIGPVEVKPGEVARVTIEGLEKSTEYRYRVGFAATRAATPTWGEPERFRTRAAAGTAFTFVVQADSHLDQGVEPKVYERTLANMREGGPDLFFDLGDTFMTDKRGPNFKAALAQYDAQRYYFGLLARSAPVFMILGNHDGEKGTSGADADDIGPWSYRQRTARFPEPLIDGAMYTGATNIKGGVGANYYTFAWGDAQFIVLDPYWSTTERIRGGGGGGGGGGGNREAGNRDEPLKPSDASWTFTLGKAQYDWLTRTLETSRARHRFVFIHHLVGGVGGNEARGGVESSKYFEWGGLNADGSDGFAQRRPGWAMPIHDLLVKHRVSAVFHGHDHLYVHAQRDGLHYQCVPQPGNPAGNTRSATGYGYASGTLRGSPGHLRVRVTPESARVEFVRTAVEGVEATRGPRRAVTEPNGAVVDSYEIRAR